MFSLSRGPAGSRPPFLLNVLGAASIGSACLANLSCYTRAQDDSSSNLMIFLNLQAPAIVQAERDLGEPTCQSHASATHLLSKVNLALGTTTPLRLRERVLMQRPFASEAVYMLALERDGQKRH